MLTRPDIKHLNDGPTAQAASRLCAIVFADAVASSTAMARQEMTTVAALDEALTLFSSLANSSGGAVGAFTGDGAFATFDSAARAVQFALAFQEEAQRLSGGLSFRVGVHVGEVVEYRGRLYGDSINVAQRLETIAPSSGIYVSETAYETVRSREDFLFENVGNQRLKGFAEPVDVFRVHGAQVAATLKPSTRPPASPTTEDVLRPPAIAVMPFRDRSDSGDQSIFAEGVADDIITNLCRFRGIDVISRSSSFALKGADLPVEELGKRLGSRYIVNGTVRRATGRTRVTVELNDAATGRTVWAERYDRPDEDIFEVQDEVAALAVGALSVTVERSEQQRSASYAPDSLHAYGLVLNATAHVLNYTANDNRRASDLFTKALELSPTYARAFAGLSRSNNLDWRYRWSDNPKQCLDDALDLAVKAVELQPSDARGYSELGFVNLYRKEHDRSLACYRRALTLNPNDANMIAEYADALAHAGLPEEALPHFDRAMRLNPFYPDQYLWDKAGALTKLRRFEDAISCIQQMNNPAQGRRILACCYGHLGHLERARAEAELIRASHPTFEAETWARNIVPDRRPEDVELFVSGLKAAGL